jgi:hypothetical protein
MLEVKGAFFAAHVDLPNEIDSWQKHLSKPTLWSTLNPECFQERMFP